MSHPVAPAPRSRPLSRGRGLRLGLLVCLLGVALPAAAAEEAPIAALGRIVGEGLAVLRLRCGQDPSCPEAKLARLRAIVTGAVDFPEFSRRAYAAGWRELTPAARGEFVEAFSDFLLAAHLPRLLERYDGEEVLLLGQRLAGPGRASVRGLLRGSGYEIPFEVQLRRNVGGWRVFDVAAFGIGAAALYRAQLTALHRTRGPGEILALLRRRGAGGPP